MTASNFRVGLGHDTHRLIVGRPLILGGVLIEHPLGLDGHSDADVLLHALTDALLGAAGLGDIGEHFPDTDPAYKGADSSKLLKAALGKVHAAGWKPFNVDCTIHAQQPKLLPYKTRIRDRVAELLGLATTSVNIKAKTGEHVGPVGREEAISADAIALIVQCVPVDSPTQAVNSQPAATSSPSVSRKSPEMNLRVYNTLTRQKEPFETVVPGQVGMYLCGPTVYKPSHIGHMVGPVIFDTVKKYLSYLGYKVKFVINITDVDDKLIVEAAKTGSTVPKIAQAMTQDYFENLAAMNVDSVDIFPYATEHIQEMQDIIQRLIDQGFAYPMGGDVYFHVSKDDDYGKLSRRNVEEMLAGTRVESNEQKKNPADFALWKGSKPGEPSWDSPWGPGRPGWHIECSAMSLKHIGETLDIHGGGLDLMFPHHENELAQSECCTGKTFTRYWLHNGLMQAGKDTGKVGGAHSRQGDALAEKEAQEKGKISKSTGAGPFKDLLAKHPAETMRFFLLSTHYRSPIDFSDENIIQVGKSLEGFHRLFETYEHITRQSFYQLPYAKQRSESGALEGDPAAYFQDLRQHRERFWEAMDDDFNTGGAVAALFDLRKTLNGFIGEQKLDGVGASNSQAIAALTRGMSLLRELAHILGVFVKAPAKAEAADDGFASKLMELILAVRAEVRKAKNYALSDLIRDRLAELKVVVEDRPDGVRWRRG